MYEQHAMLLFFTFLLSHTTLALYTKHAVYRFRNAKWANHSGLTSVSSCAALCGQYEATVPLCNAFKYDGNDNLCSLIYLRHGDFTAPYSMWNKSIPHTAVFRESSFLRGIYFFLMIVYEMLLSLWFPVSKFQVTAGHEKYAYVEVHGVAGVCSKTQINPPFPDYPASITRFERASAGFANGILLFCGGQQDNVNDNTKRCWFLDFRDRGSSTWAWDGTVSIHQWRNFGSAVGINDKVV